MRNNNTCKAFGNNERLQLLVCLEKQKTVTELLDTCTMSQSALSQHLKILRDAEIVDVHRSGKNMFYKTKNKKVLTIAKLLLNL